VSSYFQFGNVPEGIIKKCRALSRRNVELFPLDLCRANASRRVELFPPTRRSTSCHEHVFVCRQELVEGDEGDLGGVKELVESCGRDSS
jgi:hypothetical protein